jgi:nanoRNase/pAp phosphatase (c-di-AMP/oligoRNAs hydrolase)
MAGRNNKSPRNLKNLMESITSMLGGESGGHKDAAGCIIDKSKEEKFIELVQKQLEIEMVKV